MFRSIRFRLTLWYTIVVALTFLVLAWTVYLYIHTTLSVSLDSSITGEAEWVSARYDRRLLRPEPDRVTREDIFDHASFNPIKQYVEVWDSAGNIFYHSVNIGQDTLARYADVFQSTGKHLETITLFRNHEIRLMVRKTPTSTIFVAMPAENITHAVRELLRIYSWLGPAVIVIAIAMGMFLAKASLSKINNVIQTAQRITADRLYDRIPEQETKDEIGNIISTFNAMISRLDVSFRQMKQFTQPVMTEV